MEIIMKKFIFLTLFLTVSLQAAQALPTIPGNFLSDLPKNTMNDSKAKDFFLADKAVKTGQSSVALRGKNSEMSPVLARYLAAESLLLTYQRLGIKNSASKEILKDYLRADWPVGQQLQKAEIQEFCKAMGDEKNCGAGPLADVDADYNSALAA